MDKLVRMLLPFILGFALMGMWMVLVDHVARAHDWSEPRFSQLNPYQKNWMQRQRRPNTSLFCCSEADGDQVEEDIRADGHYWIRSVKTKGEWIQVPHEAVILEPNMFGAPLAWFRWLSNDGSYSTKSRDDLTMTVFCYSPGAKG